MVGRRGNWQFECPIEPSGVKKRTRRAKDGKTKVGRSDLGVEVERPRAPILPTKVACLTLALADSVLCLGRSKRSATCETRDGWAVRPAVGSKVSLPYKVEHYLGAVAGSRGTAMAWSPDTNTNFEIVEGKKRSIDLW